jgi:hypothetical protein
MVDQRLDDMPDDRVRSYIYAAVGERAKEADEDHARPIVGCLTDPLSGSGGESYLRPYFVQDTVAAARSQEYTDAVLRCFERKLEAVTDEEIAEQVSRDEADPPPATHRMAAALTACDG